jgi:hypothetical protein
MKSQYEEIIIKFLEDTHPNCSVGTTFVFITDKGECIAVRNYSDQWYIEWADNNTIYLLNPETLQIEQYQDEHIQENETEATGTVL